MKLSIIIPMFNEERTIETLVRRILAVPFPIPYEVILVDDHSSDRTAEIARRLSGTVEGDRVRVLDNAINQGKGACIRQGVQRARGELVIVQDADLEYDPQEILSLLRPILEGRAEVVYGSRFRQHRWPPGMAWPNWVANRLLTGLTNVLYRLQLTDMETCYKLLKREQLQALRLHAQRFEFEPEVTAQLGKRGIRIHEVPISYRGRTREEGKKIRAKDLAIAVWTLLRHRR